MKKSEFTIWVDADACPKMVKEIIFKTSARLQLTVVLVANSYMNIPFSPLIRFVKVEQGADVADNYIVENLLVDDLVITADIPLAGFVVEKGALAINPRGELYTEENINERLAMRNFMQDLRDGGMDLGGPAAFGTKDRAAFANSLNSLLAKKIKN